MALKLGMKHQAMEPYKVYINHDPGMTYFMARPTSKIFFPKTTWPIKVKFYRKHLYEGGTNVIIKYTRSHDQDGQHAHIW